MKQPEERAAVCAYQKGMAEDVEDHHDGLALLLVGVIAGAAGAHAVQSLERAVSWLRTVYAGPRRSGELQRHPRRRRGGPPARVLMRLLDAKGAVVARRDVTLEPGSRPRSLRPARCLSRAGTNHRAGHAAWKQDVVSTIEIFGGETRNLSIALSTPRHPAASSAAATTAPATAVSLPD